MSRHGGLGYVALVVAFTVYGQLVLKWRVSSFGAMPTSWMGQARFVLGALLDPWIMSGLAAAVLASLAWIAAMSRLELSYAYPFMALNFVLVLLLSAVLLGETVNAWRIAGVALILMGTLLVALS